MVLWFDFPVTLHFETLKLKQIFWCNQYPENFINHCKKIYFDKIIIKNLNICIVPKKELICIFPLLCKKSLEIKKRFQKVYWKQFTILKIKIIFKCPSKIVKHFHFKDVLSKKLCSENIYSFSCNSYLLW